MVPKHVPNRCKSQQQNMVSCGGCPHMNGKIMGDPIHCWWICPFPSVIPLSEYTIYHPNGYFDGSTIQVEVEATTPSLQDLGPEFWGYHYSKTKPNGLHRSSRLFHVINTYISYHIYIYYIILILIHI